MRETADYYEVLGVEAGAAQADIKKAYRALALRYHPDVNADDGAEEHIKTLNQAYAVLSDPVQRSLYDRFGAVPRMMTGVRPGPARRTFGGCRGRGMGCGTMRMWQELLRKR